MPASKSAVRRDVPAWALIAVAFFGVVVLGFFGWRAITGREGDVGPPKKVYPGMYDLRAEAAKARAAREGGEGQYGSGK